MDELLPPRLSDPDALRLYRVHLSERLSSGIGGTPSPKIAVHRGDLAIVAVVSNLDLYTDGALFRRGLPKDGPSFEEQLFIQNVAEKLGGEVVSSESVIERGLPRGAAKRPFIEPRRGQFWGAHAGDVEHRWTIAVPFPRLFDGLPPSRAEALNSHLRSLTESQGRLDRLGKLDAGLPANPLMRDLLEGGFDEESYLQSQLQASLTSILLSRLDRGLRPGASASGAVGPSGRTVYHTTFYRALPSIARHGLRKGAKGMLIFAPGNDEGVYVSDFEGVRFWYGKSVDFAEYSSDDPVQEGLVPFVLRAHLPNGGVSRACKRDELGSKDSYAQAWVCAVPIPPELLEVFDGDDWQPLARALPSLKPLRGTKAGEYGRELLSTWDSPLRPKKP